MIKLNHSAYIQVIDEQFDCKITFDTLLKSRNCEKRKLKTFFSFTYGFWSAHMTVRELCTIEYKNNQ